MAEMKRRQKREMRETFGQRVLREGEKYGSALETYDKLVELARAYGAKDQKRAEALRAEVEQEHDRVERRMLSLYGRGPEAAAKIRAAFMKRLHDEVMILEAADLALCCEDMEV